jgi:hypothetical protein
MKAGRLSRGVVSSLVVVSLMTAGSGCFGPFNLTRNVYNWNSGIKGSGEVNEKWMKEIVFFGMIVIPVYMFSALLDAFVFNAIQFWSGSNPVKVTQGPDGHIHAVQIVDQNILVTWSEDHRSAALTYQQQGRIIKTALIVEDDNGYRLLEGGRTLVLTEQALDGGVNFVDGDCRLIDHVSFHLLWRVSNDLARPSS